MLQSPSFVEGGEAVSVSYSIGAVGVETFEEADKGGTGAPWGDRKGALGSEFAAEVGLREATALGTENEGAVLLFSEGVGGVYPVPRVVG